MGIQSVTLKIPVSEMQNFMNVISKYNWEIVSKTDFNPLSVAESMPGAEVIDELAGAFAACKLDEDWKSEKSHVLEKEYNV